MSKNQTGKIHRLFKPYIVRRKNGYCTVLIPLPELDELIVKICKRLDKKKMGLLDQKDGDNRPGGKPKALLGSLEA